MDVQLPPQFTIEAMQLSDIEAATKMRLQSWLDTYVNDEYGVTREWIMERNQEQLSDVKIRARQERFTKGRATNTTNAWIARDARGEVIGSTTPYIDENGLQHLGSMYVATAWHGKGVGSALMQEVIDWFDAKKPIELGVVVYNERAKAFHRKWGFEEIADSESLFDDKIPEIRMMRKGDTS